MPRIKIGSQEIYYAARSESGAPLVFVHGAGGSHLEWNGQLAALSDVARTYALDLPGHGRSAGEVRTSVGEYAEVVLAFLDGVGIERGAGGEFDGRSDCDDGGDGCAGTGEWIGAGGDGGKARVASQILEGLDSDFEATARELVNLYYAAENPSPPAPLPRGEGSNTMVLKEKSLEQLLKTGSVVTRGDFLACDAFDVRGRLGEITAPTLVLCGDADRMTPLKYSDYLAEQIVAARLVVIRGAGHMVMLERAVEFERIIRDWLDEKARRGH